MPDKQKLVATRTLSYATRRLQAGDRFEAINRDARVLKAIGKARDDYDAPVTGALPNPPPVPSDAVPPQPVYHAPPNPPSVPSDAPSTPTPVAQHNEHDPLDALRSEAEALGLHIDRRWGEARLSQEIDAARERKAMTTESASALLPYSHERDKE
jgi:hypothetical protein